MLLCQTLVRDIFSGKDQQILSFVFFLGPCQEDSGVLGFSSVVVGIAFYSTDNILFQWVSTVSHDLI